MPKSRYILTKKVVSDLSAIWNFSYDQWSEKQADLYYNQLLQHCNVLAEKPDSGKSYAGVMKSLRGSRLNKHIIFYSSLGAGQIEIVRILHQRMDLENRLKE